MHRMRHEATLSVGQWKRLHPRKVDRNGGCLEGVSRGFGGCFVG